MNIIFQLRQFESICLEELKLLEEFGFEADIEEVTRKKDELFRQLQPALSNSVTGQEKELIESITSIQKKSELLYVQSMNSLRKTVDEIRNSKKGINTYKLDISSPSFIDHSG